MGERSFLVTIHGQAFSELKIPHDTVLEADFADFGESAGHAQKKRFCCRKEDACLARCLALVCLESMLMKFLWKWMSVMDFRHL